MAERMVAATPAGVWPPAASPATWRAASTSPRSRRPVAMWRARFHAARFSAALRWPTGASRTRSTSPASAAGA